MWSSSSSLQRERTCCNAAASSRDSRRSPSTVSFFVRGATNDSPNRRSSSLPRRVTIPWGTTATFAYVFASFDADRRAAKEAALRLERSGLIWWGRGLPASKAPPGWSVASVFTKVGRGAAAFLVFPAPPVGLFPFLFSPPPPLCVRLRRRVTLIPTEAYIINPMTR